MSALSASSALLGLAWFAAINATISFASWAVAAAVVSPRRRSRYGLLLAVRLLPAAASLMFVAALFLPSHWQFEPDGAHESFGIVVYVLATAGAAILMRSLMRAAAVAQASRTLRTCTRSRSALSTPYVYELPGQPGVSLAGVLRTRILVGPAVGRGLSRDEFEMAVAHELAHRCAFDNFKRCMMFCAPDLFAFSRRARRLEAEWRAAAESLADARAVNGDSRRALHLASALVKVAKLGAGAPATLSSPAWSTLHDPPLLEARVRRLLQGAAPSADEPSAARPIAAAAIGSIALLVFAAALAPLLHQLTEALVRALP